MPLATHSWTMVIQLSLSKSFSLFEGTPVAETTPTINGFSTGHMEASVDLAVLARFDPVAVLCEVVDDDGSMARLPKLREFVKRGNLKIISIADLIRYRRKMGKLVERASAARRPTMWGPFCRILLQISVGWNRT